MFKQQNKKKENVHVFHKEAQTRTTTYKKEIPLTWLSVLLYSSTVHVQAFYREKNKIIIIIIKTFNVLKRTEKTFNLIDGSQKGQMERNKKKIEKKQKQS